MPVDKKKWNPKDLYTTPEFPEDMRETTNYDSTGKNNRLFTVMMLFTAALLFSLAILILTGVINSPLLSKGLPNGAAKNGRAMNSLSYPTPNMPIISEIMADNKQAFAAGNGKFYDWIEIYNPTDHTINLCGFGLSDNPDKPGKFLFPDYPLLSGEFVIVFASGKKSPETALEAAFKLNNNGTLLFSDPLGNEIQRLDYLKMQQDSSYAITMGDFTRWSLTDQFSPGYPNTDQGHNDFLKAHP